MPNFKTLLMGILNVTPDSFSDAGRYFSIEKAIERGIQIADEGADIIDIGGESTRPGALKVSVEEEISRVIPVIEGLKAKLKIPISIDTMKPEVAKLAIESGAEIINDVTGIRDLRMIKLAVLSKAKICIMHMSGIPENMQKNPFYALGVVDEIIQFFHEQVKLLLQLGVEKKNIILDPGIGFGKSIADNFKIIHNLPRFKDIGFPLLVGISRKSFMSKSLDTSVDQLLPATIALNTELIMSNVDMIRVHDVKEHRMVIDIMQCYYKNKE